MGSGVETLTVSSLITGRSVVEGHLNSNTNHSKNINNNSLAGGVAQLVG